MPCWGPMRAFYPKRNLKDGTPNPDQRLVFRKDKSETGVALKIPCGKCSGCRLEQSRQWAMRCMHEKRMHTSAGSAFLTLTYDDHHIPADYGLDKRHLQLFMKRLRKQRPEGLRFYACGEYGEQFSRPHYHVLLFNTCFPDQKKLLQLSQGGHEQYTSKELDTLWGLGQTRIGQVSFESCAYVARYICKKSGAKSEDPLQRNPEFTVMSRRPGIGTAYFEKYADEIYTHDSVIVRGHESSPPRFYDTKFGARSADALEEIKKARRRKIMKLSKADNTQARLRVREVVALARLTKRAM